MTIPTVGQLFPRGDGGGALAGGDPLSDSRYANDILQRSPLGFWRLGESSGASVAVDAAGNANGSYSNCSLEQPTLIVSDTAPDKAISENGTNSRVQIGGSPGPSMFQLQSFTLMMLWRTPSDLGTNYIPLLTYDASDSWAAARGFHFACSTVPKLQLSVGTGGSYSGAVGATALAASTTYHIAATYDGSTQKVYLNGVLDGSHALSGPITYSDALRLAIGYVYFGGNFEHWGKGIFDEVAIFGAALSDAVLLNLYKSAFNI
jgi:hypothetical protein